jgi:lipid II isoglutaminyl synthase (glutamine-hydrolysing)
MSERVGRHASEDPGETLVIPAITSDAEPLSVRESTGRHASSGVDRDRPGAESLLAAVPLPGTGRSAAGQWRPPPVAEPSAEEPAEPSAEEQAEPSAEEQAEPSAEEQAEPSAEERAEPSAEQLTQPFAEALTEPPPPRLPATNGHGQPHGQPSLDARPGGDPQPPEAEPAADRRGRQRGRGGREVRLVWVYPDLLSTYGDRGNLLVLSRRAELRGIEVAAVEVNADEPVPADGDIYLLGGGEDLPQILAAARLRSDGGLQRAAENGAVVFAVCAGYQLIGRQFGGVEGEPVSGLSILDITSGRGERRGVGEVVADVDPALGVPRLTGFENHQGVTQIGPGARPLARVALGVGNGDGTEGAYAGNVLGTYLHGPALARNPGLADLLLSWAVGPLAPLDAAAENWARRLREERLAATAS